MRKLGIWLALAATTIFLFQSPSHAAHNEGPGLIEARLLTKDFKSIGVARVWNTAEKFVIHIIPADSWKVHNVQIHIVPENGEGVAIPATKRGYLIPGKFEYRDAYASDDQGHYLKILDLADDLAFHWGEPYASLRLQNISIHASMARAGEDGIVLEGEAVWAYTGSGKDVNADGIYEDVEFENMGMGWWFTYLLAHPKRGHFIDSPVMGLNYSTPSSSGSTDEAGGFDYFPDEIVQLSIGRYPIGSTVADHRISPLDLFEQADTNDLQVINLARLLQTLDEDGEPNGGIVISSTVVTAFEAAMAELGFDRLDFGDSAQIDAIIRKTVELAAAADPRVDLIEVSSEDAVVHLDSQLSASNFRKNVSKTPERGTTKSKLDPMPVLVPATRANNDQISELEYYDEDGNYLYARDKAKPLVAVYADQNAETGASDAFGAISRDDGKTWKRMNLSRSADLSSFTLVNGTVTYGDVKKPNVVVRGNKILAAWTSKFCRGGQPLYSREKMLEDGVTPYPYYEDDIWGVGGPQRSWDYTEEGFPEVGEVPYSCLWAARGAVDPVTAEIAWFKPERLTSGRRDAYQISVTGANNVGFAIIWQEDPNGVRPGQAAGPGHGWSGATTSHKTDIWYSSIKWSDFDRIDTTFAPNGDPEHSFDDPEWTTNRPKALVPFNLPMRISDNDVCNTDTMKVALDENGYPLVDENGKYFPLMDEEGKHAGTHRYCYEVEDLCTGFYEFDNNQDAPKKVCISKDPVTQKRRLLDGDTGASRPNINFMPYTKTDGSQGAWVTVAYEETKGVGSGSIEWDDSDDTTHDEEKDKPDLGKNVIYHSFNFDAPDHVSAGTIVNLPEQDVAGNTLYLVDEFGNLVLDWEGNSQLAYENARRPRMLVQPAGQAGPSNTVLVLLYKQGKEGKGRPSDIFMRRMVNPKDGKNPYDAKNLALGAQNISSITPTKYWTNPNQDDQAKGEGTKVVEWTQTIANLNDASSTNPYEDARAHRGVLKGDNLYVAFTHTPNWAASRNAHDKYDLYVRRSFNGGNGWSTDPKGAGGICHTNTFKDYSAEIEENDKIPTYDITNCFDPGEFEPARNMSRVKNNKESIIEPRLVGTPSTIAGSPYPEDVQNTDVFYVAFGTESNVPKDPDSVDEDEEGDAIPGDLFYTFTRDRGQTYYLEQWNVNPDSLGPNAGTIVERWPYLAKGDPAQGEAQLRMSPDGSKFYAIWNQEGIDGKDSWFRRIMSMKFPQNVGKETTLP